MRVGRNVCVRLCVISIFGFTQNFKLLEREMSRSVAKPLLLIIVGAILLLIHWNVDMFMDSSRNQIFRSDGVVDEGMSEVKETG